MKKGRLRGKALRVIRGHKGILIMCDVKYDFMFNQDDLESNLPDIR